MSLQWDESLELGFEEIDTQHRSIFEHFAGLSEAVQQGKPDEVIEQLARFLFEYTHVHFTTEDRIMVEYGYPQIDTQRREHGEFSRDAHELKKKIELDGATREVALETTGKLFRWILQHIKKHDREMVAYIKECSAFKQKQENSGT